MVVFLAPAKRPAPKCVNRSRDLQATLTRTFRLDVVAQLWNSGNETSKMLRLSLRVAGNNRVSDAAALRGAALRLSADIRNPQ